jgi:hypothetical protein
MEPFMSRSISFLEHLPEVRRMLSKTRQIARPFLLVKKCKTNCSFRAKILKKTINAGDNVLSKTDMLALKGLVFFFANKFGFKCI